MAKNSNSKTSIAATGGIRAKAKPAIGAEVLSKVLPQPKKNGKGQIWCPLVREGVGDWHKPSPEERVRQGFVLLLNEHYGYSFDQMRQERKTFAGKHSPRVDIVVWESVEARAAGHSPKLVVECKAENIAIHTRDYYQGESYARSVGAEILVMHNERQTAIFRLVPGLPGEWISINLIPKASDWGNAKRMEEIKNATRAFSRDEFRNLLFRCHSILRDVHKMEPGKAFDAISKILFVKMYIERVGTWGTFTTDFLRERQKTRLPNDDPVHIQLFKQTKKHYEQDELFGEADTLDEISEETFARIVKELEQFNLSATGDDVKGIAFEKFLGDTFRGDLGQFFTPRTVVDFMIQLLDPNEGELVCDPCSGSGGFLIRAFEHVRAKIEAEVQAQKDKARAEIEALELPEEEEHERIRIAFAQLNQELEPEQKEPPSRIYRLSHDYIYGADAEARAARTSKMNMIMHGDGHGGIHYHDGLLDINGIFPERFDIVLTNPPFGSNVGEDQKVGSTEQTRVPETEEYLKQCRARYKGVWEQSHFRMVGAAKNKTPILELFEIGKDKPNRPTEIVFVERCLNLLKPGGRMGVVLPDGNLNNPSLAWLRRWAEGKARLMAVVSLPEDTFKSAEASVKASLVFLGKFTSTDEAKWEETWRAAHTKFDADFAKRRTELCAEYGLRICAADDPKVIEILEKLGKHDVKRTFADSRLKSPPPYPKGIIQSEIGKPKWEGSAFGKDAKAAARALRTAFDEAWDEAHEEKSEELRRELRTALRKIDREHSRALWAEVRTTLDYPVFTAAPENVGITSTGADGPNDLPEVLDAWRAFDKWVKAGSKEDQLPSFAL
jgi:type I restriction enzyme M protein